MDSGSTPRRIWAYELTGQRISGTGWAFSETEPWGYDGIRCDIEGNIWAGASGGAGNDGVHVLAPDGDRIGQIRAAGDLREHRVRRRSRQPALHGGQHVAVRAVRRRARRLSAPPARAVPDRTIPPHPSISPGQDAGTSCWSDRHEVPPRLRIVAAEVDVFTAGPRWDPPAPPGTARARPGCAGEM